MSKYDDLVEIAEKSRQPFAPNLDILDNLPKYEELLDLERDMRENQELTFDRIFEEQTGYYLMRCFLIADYSVDKAVFLKDVELFRRMRDSSARVKVGRLLFARYVAEVDTERFTTGASIFHRDNTTMRYMEMDEKELEMEMEGLFADPEDSEEKDILARSSIISPMKGKGPAGFLVEEPSEVDHDAKEDEFMLELRIGQINAIGYYGPTIEEVRTDLQEGYAPSHLFDEIALEVLNDLRMDVFPRFIKSSFYKKYIRLKSLERIRVSQKDFTTLRMLGRGAFGAVNACVKKNTGKLYASKSISKRRVMALDSVANIMSERNILAAMDSRFVTGLKYAVQDDNNLYLIMDLMIGGDLKYHLNREVRFSEHRSRIYAAEVLLGLDHIHSKGVIYRDVKLENVLLDAEGHCKVSDVGLAVMTEDRVKGYAGTPGYTAPEVIMMSAYDKMCDFFSYGVMVYRFLSGRKPFGSHTGSADLDKNVVSVEPEFPFEFFSEVAADLLSKLMIKDPRRRLGVNGVEEIKSHPWFDPIDWGLLEAGYVTAPFIPKVNMESLRHYGRPPPDDKYKRVKLSEDFHRSLKGFGFMSTAALQSELVECMELDDEGMNFERFGRTSLKAMDDSEAPKRCCILL